MKKLDLKKELGIIYKTSAKKVEFVEVPSLPYLCVDGHGDPNISEAYQKAVELLFATSYTLKFMVKKGPMELDYGVMPLEGLWWVQNMAEFDVNNKENWEWTSLMLQPNFITEEMVAEAKAQVEQKKGLDTSLLQFKEYKEGKAAQIMHIGPFSEEGPTIQRLHDEIEAAGFTLSGKHHEIYLSDIRRAAPEKWKTIIRQPYS